jgi:hypothetical protein
MSAVNDTLDGVSNPSPASSTAIFDPAKIARQYFGFEFNLASRDQLIAQLATVPIEEETGDGEPAPAGAASPSPRPRVTIVGVFSAPYLAATTLQDYLPHLGEVVPLDSSSGEACNPRPLLPLITNAVNGIVTELSKPEGPLSDSVNNFLGILCGYDKDKPTPPMTAKDVQGLFGDYARRSGLASDAPRTCSPEEEKILTTFSNVLAVSNMLLQVWDLVHESDGGQYFSIAIPRFRRNFRAIVLDLEQLSCLVPMADWKTSQIPEKPRVFAWDLYQWIYGYADQGAMTDLEDGGKDAVGVVSKTISAMKQLLEKLRSAKPAAAGECSGIAATFKTEDVTAALTQLSCHMNNVIDIARDLGA